MEHISLSIPFYRQGSRNWKTFLKFYLYFPLLHSYFFLNMNEKKSGLVHSDILCYVGSFKNIWVHLHNFLRETFVLPREAGNGYEKGEVFHFYVLNPSVMFTGAGSWRRIGFSQHKEKGERHLLGSLVQTCIYWGRLVQKKQSSHIPARKKKCCSSHTEQFSTELA